MVGWCSMGTFNDPCQQNATDSFSVRPHSPGKSNTFRHIADPIPSRQLHRSHRCCPWGTGTPQIASGQLLVTGITPNRKEQRWEKRDFFLRSQDFVWRVRSRCKSRCNHQLWNDGWLVVWNIFYFPFHIWDNHPNWLIFFRGVETTNQMGFWWW